MTLELYFLDAYKKLQEELGREPSVKEAREKTLKLSGRNDSISYSTLYGYAKKHSLQFAKFNRGHKESLVNDVLAAYNDYKKKHGRTPTGKIIGQELGISSVYAHQLLNSIGIHKKKCSLQLIDVEYKAYVKKHGQAPTVLKLSKEMGILFQTVNGFLLKYDLKKKYAFGKEAGKKDEEIILMQEQIKKKYVEFLEKNKRPPSESELATACGCTHSKVKYSIWKLKLECSDGHKFRREAPADIAHPAVNGQFWNNAKLVFTRERHPSPYGAIKTKSGYIVKQIGARSIRMKEPEFVENYMNLDERMKIFKEEKR